MLIRTLRIENFGTYAGINEINLVPDGDRPIVLIGGPNGAGKTTLLESILLCLHGRRALSGSLTTKAYFELIGRRFHVPAEGAWRPSECSVTLEFEIAEDGVVHQYDVTRRWRRTAAGAILEELTLCKDQEPIDELPESAWQDFLDGLVPPGVAGLFFFDGERIQALAEDDSGVQLRETVRRLLGLDLIEQLRLDLSRYVTQAGTSELATAEATAADRAQEAQAARDRIAALREERDALMARRNALAAEAERTRSAFARRGGMLARERTRLQDEHRRACEAASIGETKVRELVAGLLPFALCPDLTASVERRIEQEAAAEEGRLISERLREAAPKLRRSLTTKRRGDVVEELERLLRVGTTADEPRVHDLTPTEKGVLSDQLRRLRTDVPKAARELARELRRAEEARARTKELLEKAPDPSDVAELLAEVQSQERALGSIGAEIERVDEALDRATYEHKVAERERKRAASVLRDATGAANRVAHAVRIGALLAEFEDRSQVNKLEAVEVEAARFFNRLSRKGSMLGRVEIDPSSFQVGLRRWDEADLPKERLSAGEKQLLAISLLWALAKVSGRPLPVVIDTPLARLDREHRDRLLTEYFPSVSHQVVVLSTDTEVDAAAAASLRPSVSHTYQLVHDAKECRTTVHDGYFSEDVEALDAR